MQAVRKKKRPLPLAGPEDVIVLHTAPETPLSPENRRVLYHRADQEVKRFFEIVFDERGILRDDTRPAAYATLCWCTLEVNRSSACRPRTGHRGDGASSS